MKGCLFISTTAVNLFVQLLPTYDRTNTHKLVPHEVIFGRENHTLELYSAVSPSAKSVTTEPLLKRLQTNQGARRLTRVV